MQKKNSASFLMRSFLPPCGDKLQSIAKLASAIARYALSPPYTGMVRIPLNSSRTLTSSRPLAGISCNALTPIASPRLLGSRPLTGIVLSGISISSRQARSRPLTGIVPQMTLRQRRPLSSRPLTGMVLTMMPLLRRASFRPLTGMVRQARRFSARRICFRLLTGMAPRE